VAGSHCRGCISLRVAGSHCRGCISTKQFTAVRISGLEATSANRPAALLEAEEKATRRIQIWTKNGVSEKLRVNSYP